MSDMVLAIAGSPRRDGNTDRLLDRAMTGVREAGLEVVRLAVREKRLSGCVSCGGCLREGRCLVNDDMQTVFRDIDRVRHVIVASPVFFMGLPGQLKCLIDRCQVYWSRQYRRHEPSGRERPGGNVSVILVGGTGFEHLFDQPKMVLKAWAHVLELKWKDELLLRRIDARGDVEKHPEALESAYRLGRTIAETPGQ